MADLKNPNDLVGRAVNPSDAIPNQAPVLAKGGDAVASSGYKVPASETEGPKNLEGKNATLAQDDADLESAREISNKGKIEGDAKGFKSAVAEEHKEAHHGGANDDSLRSEAAKLKKDLISKHPEVGGNRASS